MTLRDFDCSTVCTLSISGSGTSLARILDGMRWFIMRPPGYRERMNWPRRCPRPKDDEIGARISLAPGMMKASWDRNPDRDCGRNGTAEAPVPELVLAEEVLVDVAATAAAVAAASAAAAMFDELDVLSVWMVRALFGLLVVCLVADADSVADSAPTVNARRHTRPSSNRSAMCELETRASAIGV